MLEETKEVQRVIEATTRSTIENLEQTRNNERASHIYACFQPITVKIFTDQIGKLPYPSISGNKYMFALYDCNANYNDAVPMPSKKKHKILDASKKAHSCVKKEDSHQNYKDQTTKHRKYYSTSWNSKVLITS